VWRITRKNANAGRSETRQEGRKARGKVGAGKGENEDWPHHKEAGPTKLVSAEEKQAQDVQVEQRLASLMR